VRAPAILVVSYLMSSSLQAQILDLPRRPARPTAVAGPADTIRTQQDLTLEFHALGGVDDNLAPAGTGASEFEARPGGYLGSSGARLTYDASTSRRSLNLIGRSYMNTFRNVGMTPSYGGDVSVRAQTAIGRRGEFEIRQAVRYDPYFSLGGFNVVQTDPAAPPIASGPTSAIAETRSWNNDTGVSLRQRRSPRTTISMDYDFNKRVYETGIGFDNRTHRAILGYDHSFGRSTGVRATYRYSDMVSFDLGGRPLPVDSHMADLGFSYAHNFSRTRRISLSGGAGAEHVETINNTTRQGLTYWVPSGYSTAQVDLGRTWTILANYRRSLSMLQGLTPQAFVTDGIDVNLGGFIAPGTDVAVMVASSNGYAGGQGAGAGQSRNYSATGQVRFAVTEWWSAVVSYTRYRYRLDEAASRALGVPSRMDRNAVQAGISVMIPVVGR
jgi:hypothetical protein